MHMEIDEARRHVAAGDVQGSLSIGPRQIRFDRRDATIGNTNVKYSVYTGCRIENRAAGKK